MLVSYHWVQTVDLNQHHFLVFVPVAVELLKTMHLLRSEHTYIGPSILKSLFTNNVKSVTETVMKMLAEKESEKKLKEKVIDNLTKQHNTLTESLKSKDAAIEQLKVTVSELEILLGGAIYEKEKEIDTARKDSLDAKSALHLKEKEVRMLRNKREKETELVEIEKEKLRNDKAYQDLNEMQMLRHKREIELLKTEHSRETEILRNSKEKDLFTMSKLLTAVESNKKEVAELKGNNKTQKEQIDRLEKQKESIQEIVCELETHNEKLNTEIENFETQWEFAAVREEKLLTQEEQIRKVQAMTKSLGQRNFRLRRKIQRHVRNRKEEEKKERKAFTRLVTQLKAKSWKLKTELNSTIFWFERSKVRSKVEGKKVDELLFENRRLQNINKHLLSMNEDC